MTLPRWLSHKVVEAAAIAAIEFAEDGHAKIALRPPATGIYVTKRDFDRRFKGSEEDLGYLVVYTDGYESWSPTAAFEEGYTAIGDPPND